MRLCETLIPKLLTFNPTLSNGLVEVVFGGVLTSRQCTKPSSEGDARLAAELTLRKKAESGSTTPYRLDGNIVSGNIYLMRTNGRSGRKGGSSFMVISSKWREVA